MRKLKFGGSEGPPWTAKLAVGFAVLGYAAVAGTLVFLAAEIAEGAGKKVSSSPPRDFLILQEVRKLREEHKVLREALREEGIEVPGKEKIDALKLED